MAHKQQQWWGLGSLGNMHLGSRHISLKERRRRKEAAGHVHKEERSYACFDSSYRHGCVQIEERENGGKKMKMVGWLALEMRMG